MKSKVKYSDALYAKSPDDLLHERARLRYICRELCPHRTDNFKCGLQLVHKKGKCILKIRSVEVSIILEIKGKNFERWYERHKKSLKERFDKEFGKVENASRNI